MNAVKDSSLNIDHCFLHHTIHRVGATPNVRKTRSDVTVLRGNAHIDIIDFPSSGNVSSFCYCHGQHCEVLAAYKTTPIHSSASPRLAPSETPGDGLF